MVISNMVIKFKNVDICEHFRTFWTCRLLTPAAVRGISQGITSDCDELMCKLLIQQLDIYGTLANYDIFCLFAVVD